MIEIDGCLVSRDVLTARFGCDLASCRGVCCVEGDAGAPLDEEEGEALRAAWEAYRPWLPPAAVQAIREQGFMVRDAEGEWTTPLVGGAECAYAFCRNGVWLCAVEHAWREGRCAFRKPLSCHLYPIRIVRFASGTVGLNYHRWSVCGVDGGSGLRVFEAVREALERRFGAEFYRAMEAAADYLERGAKAEQ